MRDLLVSDAPRARLAVDLFVHAVACALGSLAAALGGLDAVVFTAGIGENSAEIRRRVIERSAWLGLALDAEATRAAAPAASAPREPRRRLGHPHRRAERHRPRHPRPSRLTPRRTNAAKPLLRGDVRRPRPPAAHVESTRSLGAACCRAGSGLAVHEG
jgi:hypothetical protein